jgi:ATP-dependent Lon protease
MSLGGVRDEAECVGTVVRISVRCRAELSGGKKAGVNNPVMMLDEIDKLGNDYRSDPSAALLEFLQQNNSFRITMTCRLISTHLFHATANQLGPIPTPLRDRMETIRLAGYSDRRNGDRQTLSCLPANPGKRFEYGPVKDHRRCSRIDRYSLHVRQALDSLRETSASRKKAALKIAQAQARP